MVPYPLAPLTVILSLYFPECKAGITPIFEAQLSLVPPELIFHPSLDSGVKGGLCDIVEHLLSSIFAIPSLVPRLSPHSGSPHYQVLDLQASAFLHIWKISLSTGIISLLLSHSPRVTWRTWLT